MPPMTTSPSRPALAVASSGRHLLRGDEFFPLIIDTAWSVFADASEEEWRIYLAARRRQGFTAVLVTVLPILHAPLTVDARFDDGATTLNQLFSAADQIVIAERIRP